MRSNLYRTSLAAVLVGVLPLGAAVAAHAPSPATRPHRYHVTIGIDAPYALMSVHEFLPGKLTVHVGDSVQWTNAAAGDPQTITFGPIDYTPALFLSANNAQVSPEANPAIVRPQGGRSLSDASSIHSSGALMSGVRGLGASYTFTFRAAGTYFYRSLFHPLMLGEIDVVPASRPASADPPDRGDSAVTALRSTADALLIEQRSDEHASDSGGVSVSVGFGNKDMSLNIFAPSGIQIHVGDTVTWQTTETSGDPHAIFFLTAASVTNPGAAPLYTRLASDGGLTVNPAYGIPTLPTGSQIMTGTIASNQQYSSGLLYGSSPAYPSATLAKYTLTFLIPGRYYYIDPFHGNGTQGQVHVLP